jgi:ABC-2 type transport system ATP-binding protein
MAAIQTRGLTKDFGRGKGIFDLDLEVEPGTVHGFLGPNGAGKSTTIRLLLDFLRPTRGSARILDHDARTESLEIRRRVGYLPGEISLPSHLTGRKFLEDSAAIRGKVDREFRRELIQRFGVQVEPRIRTLSKGNKQKLALVDALQHRPPVLILDEPTDGLDPLLRAQVHDVLRDHARSGGTVFLSSHVVHEIQTTCDTVSIILDGTLRHSDTIEGLLAREPTRIQAQIGARRSVRALSALAGVHDVFRSGNHTTFLLHGPILPAMQELLRMQATDVRVRQHDLEETFLRLYQEGQDV